ncbi:MAG TPA: DUF4369 domain-containing protein, partial [Candidatus Sphingobacterium stercoripullorum]|nr:DUF4369 domain-containing protein [Candidatus Sphingobacterium stercoripullorum]
MKNILIAMMGVFFLLQSCAEKTQKNEFILKGEITGIEDGTAELVLTDEENRESTVVDSVKIVNGKFEFSQKLEAPELFAINLLPGNFSLTLFLEPGDIEVIIDTLNAIHYDYSEYGGGKGARLTEYQVKGSKSEGVIQTYEEHPTIKAAKDFYKEKNKAFDQEEDSDKKEDIRAEIIQFREQQV